MAFKLTSFVATPTKAMDAGLSRAAQRYVLKITGLVGDVALDIGTVAGTFWTAAKANADTGAMATEVLALLEANAANLDFITNIFVPELSQRAIAAATSGVVYTRTLNTTTKLPLFTFAANEGATAYTVVIDYQVIKNILPISAGYNV